MHTKKISNVKTNRTIHPRRQQMFALTHAEVDLIVLTRDLLSAGQTASLSLSGWGRIWWSPVIFPLLSSDDSDSSALQLLHLLSLIWHMKTFFQSIKEQRKNRKLIMIITGYVRISSVGSMWGWLQICSPDSLFPRLISPDFRFVNHRLSLSLLACYRGRSSMEITSLITTHITAYINGPMPAQLSVLQG